MSFWDSPTGNIIKTGLITAGTGGVGAATDLLGGGFSRGTSPTSSSQTGIINGKADPAKYAARQKARGAAPWVQAPNGSYYGSAKAAQAASTAPTTSAPAATPGAAPTSTAPTYGTESGPGIMQQWFGERANGTDPGWEYGLNRASTALNNQYAARGGYNSGAATQGLSDMYSNLTSQREGQLDTLAGAASGERNNNLSTMLGFGTGLAGSEAGLGGTYDVAGANAMSGANNAGLGYGAQAAMIPYLANQGFMSNLFKL